MIRLKTNINFEEADKLIDRYYDGLTSGEEEKRLHIFLSRTDLPSKYHAEQAIFGYFGATKNKPVIRLKPYLSWASGIAAMVALVVGLNFYSQSVSATNFAYVDGHKITNKAEVKKQALASLNDISGGETEVEQSLDNVSDADVINQQLNVFAEQ